LRLILHPRAGFIADVSRELCNTARNVRLERVAVPPTKANIYPPHICRDHKSPSCWQDLLRATSSTMGSRLDVRGIHRDPSVRIRRSWMCSCRGQSYSSFSLSVIANGSRQTPLVPIPLLSKSAPSTVCAILVRVSITSTRNHKHITKSRGRSGGNVIGQESR
jgi:hypothetical protein